MKGRLLVLLDPNVPDLDAALETNLEPHCLDEDAESFPKHYWDYWHLTSDPFGASEPANSEIRIDTKCAGNARVASNLDSEYLPSAIITPDGQWNDLSDHGWRLVDEPCESNSIALRKWELRFANLCVEYSNMIGVEVLYHC